MPGAAICETERFDERQRYIWDRVGDRGGLLIEEDYVCTKVRSFDTSEAGTTALVGWIDGARL